MKRIIMVALFGLSVFGLSAQILDMPVAIVRLTETVNIGQRNLSAQIDLFAAQLGRALTAAEKRQILDALMNDELLLQAAARANLRVSQEEISSYLEIQRQQWSQAVGAQLTDEQFRQQVQRQTGSTWTEYVEDVTNELIKLKYVRQEKSALFADLLQRPITADIEQFYEEQATSFTNPAMVSFRHIYIDLRGKSDAQREAGRARIAELRRQIRDGVATFDSVSRASVDDPGYSAADFGYLLRNDARNQALLGRSFVDRVFAMQVGDVSDVIESSVALHIVLILDKRAPRILGLDDPLLPGQNVTVRQQISGLIAAQKEQEVLGVAVDELVAELRLEAEVTVFENNLPW
jgi:peptidyl-prolyl cis-trans isomerase SurA